MSLHHQCALRDLVRRPPWGIRDFLNRLVGLFGRLEGAGGPLVGCKVLLLLGALVNVRVLDLPRFPAILLGVGASVHWSVWMGRGLDRWVVVA